MEFEQIIESISKELSAELIKIEKTQTIEEKVQHSTIIKNLSKSLGVFLTMPCGYQANDVDEDDEAEINEALAGKLGDL